MARLTLILFCLFATPLRADDVALQQRIEAALGPRGLERWVEAPQYVLDDVARLTFSYGHGMALTLQNIESSIAHDRAAARARAVRDLLTVDLNGDLNVSSEEAAKVEAALSGRERARLWKRIGLADADDDGVAQFEEIGAYAISRSLETLPEARADQRRALMLLDRNGDGSLAIPEAEAALKALANSVRRVSDGRTARDL